MSIFISVLTALVHIVNLPPADTKTGIQRISDKPLVLIKIRRRGYFPFFCPKGYITKNNRVFLSKPLNFQPKKRRKFHPSPLVRRETLTVSARYWSYQETIHWKNPFNPFACPQGI
jgi:hypothetical protein